MQRAFEVHPLRASLHKGAAIYKQYRKLCLEEKKFWAARAKCQWIQAADTNSKYFHMQVKVQRLQNKIVCIQAGDRTLTTPHDIMSFVLSEFSNLYNLDAVAPDLCAWYWEAVPKIVSKNDNAKLLAVPTLEELSHIISTSEDWKTPGLDGVPTQTSLGGGWSPSSSVYQEFHAHRSFQSEP